MTRLARLIRRNLVAWLALFVALGGTSLAASHYIITSTKQIKPSVLRELHGATGPEGRAGPGGAPGVLGPAGPQGPQGQSGSNGSNGQRGEPGPEGQSGTTILARARSVESAVTPTSEEPPQEAKSWTPYPLIGATWTQSPNELDELPVAFATASVPPVSECNYGPAHSPTSGGIGLYVDGQFAGTVFISNSGASTEETRSGEGVLNRWLPEPVGASAHTLTAKIADTCGGFGGQGAGHHFTIRSVSVDVLGAK